MLPIANLKKKHTAKSPLLSIYTPNKDNSLNIPPSSLLFPSVLILPVKFFLEISFPYFLIIRYVIIKLLEKSVHFLNID